ncbi:MAG: DUF6111 family protein [Minwuiales bacterium]|nr:DUF6111 family protein [Minwuiales bacterium]
MLKKFLFTVIPMLVPFIIYGIYWIGAKRRQKIGVSDVPWTMLFTSGLALVVISLAFFGFTSGHEAGLDYSPARMEDGRVVPGETR